MTIWFGLSGGRMYNMKKVVKRISIIFLFASMTFIFTGCFKGSFINSDKIAKQQCEAVLEYLDNDDVEGLKSMFCNKTVSSLDLDEQIQDAMNVFEGKTISYQALTSIGGRSYENGQITRLDITPSIINIVTDTDKEYEITFYSYLICVDDRDKEGISKISIKFENGQECIIGEYIR